MKNYVSVDQIQAKPMTLGDYNSYRGWTIPQDENPLDEGYLIERDGTHQTWMPKDVFEKRFIESFDSETIELKHNSEMVELKHDLLTTKYTTVYQEKDFQFNAPHLFEVCASDNSNGTVILASIHFQEGPIKENGVNGVCNEDLLHMVISRLEHFQKSPFSSRDNALAITHIEDALLRLRKRTIAREARGVEGTNVV